ncbi:MAG: hypothetical protein PWP16_455 [Eubacteriaceae bacterium]|nr:hypothetical protein [Eubacteriaceae bacterium]
MRADVKIGDKWMEADMGFIFNSKSISPPDPNLVTIEIPGTSDVIDLTESISGDIEYKQRSIMIKLESAQGKDSYYSKFAELANYAHGKKMKITFNKDQGYYWIGRITVASAEPKTYGSTITITATVDPYKYKIVPDQYDFTVEGTYELTLVGSRKRTCPIIMTDTAMTVTYLENTYDLIVGENTILDIFLGEGDHVLTFTGAGIVSVIYDGGSL